MSKEKRTGKIEIFEYILTAIARTLYIYLLIPSLCLFPSFLFYCSFLVFLSDFIVVIHDYAFKTFEP